LPLVKGEVVKTTPPPIAPPPVVPPIAPPAGASAEPAMPTGPPVPLLQQHGYQGSIQDFNGRVQSVHDEYQKAYWPRPVARSNVRPRQVKC